MHVPVFVLASGSPRRAGLLRDAGYRFEIFVPDVDERPLPGESPAAMVERVAAVKALSAGRIDAVVLGVDTTVVIDGESVGKPTDEASAVETLLRLAGRTHVVLSGWAVLSGERVASGIERTLVEMRAIERSEAESYAAGGEPLDKAGAYAIQGMGRSFVTAIKGSESNVMGMPMEALEPVLHRFGVTPAAPP